MAYTEPFAVTVLCTVPLGIGPAMPPFVGWEVIRKAFFALPKTVPPTPPTGPAPAATPPTPPFAVTDIAPADGSMPLPVLYGAARYAAVPFWLFSDYRKQIKIDKLVEE